MRSLLIGLVATLLPLSVATPSEGDLSDIRTVIERQVTGLREDNASLLASTITTEAKSLFTDETTVLSIFKQHFPGASGVRVSSFGTARRTELGFVQPVQISDQTGRVFQALYAVAQDEDGHWLISDFVVVEVPTLSA
jgi:hypothetical protein